RWPTRSTATSVITSSSATPPTPRSRRACAMRSSTRSTPGGSSSTAFKRRSDMSLFDAYRFDGKRVLVVGGATGMGAAAAELALEAGADVVVMDYAKVSLTGVKAIRVDLAQKAS